MRRVARGIVGVTGALLMVSQAGANITAAYSEDFSGYSNGYSLGGSSHYAIVRNFYAGTVNPANTYAKYVSAYPGQLTTQAATEGQLALIYKDESVGTGSFKASVDVTGANAAGVKGGLVFNWSTLADSQTVSGYVFQIYKGSPSGSSGINVAVRLIKYANADGSATNGEAPTPSGTLLSWTDLAGFSALSSSTAVTLSVTSDGNGSFVLSAVQGTLSWTANITDSSALSGGYVGIATERGRGADEASDTRDWASTQYDNFTVAPAPAPVPEPAALGLLGVGGLLIAGMSRRL